MNPVRSSTCTAHIRASQLLGEISMSDVHSKGIESNAASMTGANCRSALANMIHLVVMKSIEGAVTGFLQNRSTSLPRVIRYSQIARADCVVSAHVQSHVA